MRRTTSERPKPAETTRRRSSKGTEGGARDVTLARYRVALVREPGYEYEVPEDCLNRPLAAVEFCWKVLSDWDREVLGVLFLDSRQRPLGYQIAFVGTAERCSVCPREILRAALLKAASSFILFHNHPSGDPSPSLEDVEFTRRVARAGDIVGVTLVDHLVLGSGRSWVSLRRRGAW